LLMVLECNEVVPVGEVRSCPAEFRLVTATSRDLRTLVESGHFRPDLFHHIAWHTIEISMLRAWRAGHCTHWEPATRRAGDAT
jgi:transcriptional regulator of acetoin/glycerol metabolism